MEKVCSELSAGVYSQDLAQMLLTHVDWIGNGHVIGNLAVPVLTVAPLCSQIVVKCGQTRRLKRCAVADAAIQDCTGSCCEATQRVAYT